MADRLRWNKPLWFAYQIFSVLPRLARLFSPKSGARYDLRVTLRRYRSYKRNYPDRDVNAWLAATLRKCRPYWSEPGEDFWYVETAPYSVLSGANPEVVFACSIAMANYETVGEDDSYINQVLADFEKIVSPVREAVRQGDFVQVWRQRNPWTARHVAQVVEAISDAGFLSW